MFLVFILDVEPPPLWSHPFLKKHRILTGKTPRETPLYKSKCMSLSHLCSSSSRSPHTTSPLSESLIPDSKLLLITLNILFLLGCLWRRPIWEPLWFLPKVQKEGPATWEANTCISLMRNHLLRFFQPLTSSREPDISEPDFMTFRTKWQGTARPWCGRCLGL